MKTSPLPLADFCPVLSQLGVNSVWPFEGDEAQGCYFSDPWAPNNHTQTSRSSANLDLPNLLLKYSTLVMIGADPRQYIMEHKLGQWLELDRLLGQLLGLYSIRPKILCYASPEEEETIRDLVRRLLPETTGGGTVNLVTTGWVMNSGRVALRIRTEGCRSRRKQSVWITLRFVPACAFAVPVHGSREV